ncbi:MAG: nucleotidyltransferase domain-containing protein, partial [Saprospiraceae bacterium]
MTDTYSPAVECPTRSAVLRALAYFEVFSYPLTWEEVFAFCCEPSAAPEDVFDALQTLVEQGRAFRFGSFFQTKKDMSWVEHRLDCNRRADRFLPRARRMARFIGRFPFVRGVFVSGSLSKHCMRPDSDVDFFVVTEPGRLWLARTLLVLFKKVFLLNSHKYFCVNYFVDTEHLEIEEKNLFTATESVTLLPMWGREFYADFCRSNAWAWECFPHFSPRPTAGVPPHSRGFFKKMLEKALSGKMGGWLDQKAMRLTVGFWKRKFRDLDGSTFDLALKSRRGVSK